MASVEIIKNICITIYGTVASFKNNLGAVDISRFLTVVSCLCVLVWHVSGLRPFAFLYIKPLNHYYRTTSTEHTYSNKFHSTAFYMTSS